jgi:diadenosine tetraphosphatase ApaH/serine/threonine PP2A family protein phosphatase
MRNRIIRASGRPGADGLLLAAAVLFLLTGCLYTFQAGAGLPGQLVQDRAGEHLGTEHGRHLFVGDLVGQVGALLAQDMLGSDGLAGMPTALFTLGSALAAELCFDATDHRISFIGHSHVALSFHRPEGDPATGTTRREGEEVDLASGEWLLNPGSSGQPRDGDARAAWLALDTDRLTATWRRAEYDIAGAQAAIRAANLPDSLAERLQYGQ